MNYESVAVYRNKKTGRLVVQPMTRHPTGASGEFGASTELADEELDARLLPTLLDNLEKYHRQAYVSERAPKYSGKEYTRFTREHDLVSVTRLETGVIEVNPSERVRGGYRGLNAQMIVLSPDEVPTKLVTAIRQAFALCS